MQIRPGLLIGVGLAVAAVVVSARADMAVRLKDGRVFTIPVDNRDDVGSIEYRKAVATPQSPAERAAKLLRREDDAAQSASKAAAAALEASREARAAAREATAAARAAEAALRGAEEAAQQARRSVLGFRRYDDRTAGPAKPPAAKAEASAPRHPVPAVKKPAPALKRPPVVVAKRPPPAAATPHPASKGARKSTERRILSVGPGKDYAKPSEAARAARDGDIIEIQAGTYVGDVAVWHARNITIRSVGGRAHLKAGGNAAEGKAIWVTTGENITIDGIEFSGCRVPDKNGAGIRAEGNNLTIRNSYFHDNEMGLMTSARPASDILIENSEFAYNTADYEFHGRLGHNIYIGDVHSFTLRNSYVHHAMFGHNVKSRAHTNRILYNRIMDGKDGRSSYAIDLPNGGRSYLVGNVVQQSRLTENSALIHFGRIGTRGGLELIVVNNTFVNDLGSGNFVRRQQGGETRIVNNIFYGGGEIINQSATIKSNLVVVKKGLLNRLRKIFDRGEDEAGGVDRGQNVMSTDAGFVDPDGFDYRLKEGSAAIDAGIDAGETHGISLVPDREFGYPGNDVVRKSNGKIDIGAYEFNG